MIPLLVVTLLAPAMQAPAPDARRATRERIAQGRLNAGDTAPDFELKRLHSQSSVRLSAFRGQRPVALVFGSYT